MIVGSGATPSWSALASSYASPMAPASPPRLSPTLLPTFRPGLQNRLLLGVRWLYRWCRHYHVGFFLNWYRRAALRDRSRTRPRCSGSGG
ncbi:hypothetical protein ACXX9E_29600 [Pseudomonas sp. GNP014]